MVIVFKVKTLLELVHRVAPILHRSFERIGKAVGSRRERQVVEEVYRQLESMNFSRGLMEPITLKHSSALLVLPVRGVYWSDWGSEQRILSGVKMPGSQERRRGAKTNRNRKLAQRNSTVPSKR